MASAFEQEGFAVIMKLLGRGMAAAFVIWLYFNGLLLRYNSTRPTKADPAEGRIYPLIMYGHTVYLTHAERIHLLISEVLPVIIVVICIPTLFFYKRKMVKEGKSYLFGKR